MPEGEKKWGVPVAIGGDNPSSPFGIGLTGLPNIGVASGPPGPPPGSGITDIKEPAKTADNATASYVNGKRITDVPGPRSVTRL